MRWSHAYTICSVLPWLCLCIYLLVKTTRSRVGLVPRISRFHSPLLEHDFGITTLLDDLGFVFNPRLYPQSYHGRIDDMPVFVAVVTTRDYCSFVQFVRSLRLYYPDKKVVLYNYDLDVELQKELGAICRCLIRNVQWEMYPPHVQNSKYQAYRPIIVQKALTEFGVVFWCEHTLRFTSGDVASVVTHAQRTGVVAWPVSYPTSAFTHYNTFRYFNVSHQSFYQHKMAETDGVLVINTQDVHRKLMLPWVKCALDMECVAPVGAQAGVCRLNRKPNYSYTGCHKYDMSAFNIALGLMFNRQTPYISQDQLYQVAT